MSSVLPVVYGTGLSGLVGSKLVKDLSDRYRFVNLDLSNGVDILKPESIADVLDQEGKGEALIHLAAFTDANAAQEQTGDKNGSAYQVNVVGTENIAEACAARGLHMIHLSTSYVFDGTKASAYTEEDEAHPTEWYGETKLEAERVVQQLLPKATILRISFPYRKDEFPKPDIWRKMAGVLEAGKNGPFFSDHRFTLTPLDWFSRIMAWCIENKPAGIFHTTTSKVYTDLSLAREIALELGEPRELQPSSVYEYNQTAARPYQPNLVLSNEKLKQAMGNAFPEE